MTKVSKTEASLRFFSDALSPDEVTRALGAVPTHSDVKGQRVEFPPQSKRIARRGSWRLRAFTCEPGDLDAQVTEIFSNLTDDLSVWRALASAHDADLFCGLFLGSFNDGLTLSPESMGILADRGVTLSLDIYEREGDDIDNDHA